MADECVLCYGSKHIRTASGGWTRCKCISQVIQDMFIKPQIKCGEVELPTKFLEVKQELKDYLFVGEFNEFRYIVWASLLKYPELTYEYMDAYRLVEIYLDQDSQYKRVRDLEDLDLVVIVLGVSDLPNKMLAPLLIQLLKQRKMLGKPTWTFSSYSKDRLCQIHGSDLAVVLGMNPFQGGVPPPHKPQGPDITVRPEGQRPARFDPRDI